MKTSLRFARRKMEITQDFLARQAGCAQSSVSRIEAGIRAPSPQVAARIAKVLGLPVEKLFEAAKK